MMRARSNSRHRFIPVGGGMVYTWRPQLQLPVTSLAIVFVRKKCNIVGKENVYINGRGDARKVGMMAKRNALFMTFRTPAEDFPGS
jgi:hypothetical protein